MSEITEAAKAAKQAAAEAVAALDAREAELREELAEIRLLKGRRPRVAKGMKAKGATRGEYRKKTKPLGVEASEQA
jgi:hypothetical protein